MNEVQIIDGVRTPFAKGGRALAEVHPADLLAVALSALIERTGIDPNLIGQVVGGCVDQVGEQALNVTRTAWLVADFPEAVGVTTVDSQCGSSQQALTLAAALVGSGTVDLAIACGVESMTRVPGLSNLAGLAEPVPPSYYTRYGEFTLQFEGAERIATRWGITRRDCDEFGLSSQQRAADAWAAGRFDRQITPVPAHLLGPGAANADFARDEGLRPTTLDGLAALNPVHRTDGVVTAGTSSQISDGASAVLVASPEAAARARLRAKASIVDQLLVGSDPILMLTGPIPATRELLARNSLTIADIDLFEINEAFAPVVLAWERELKPDMDRVNPDGGAIALGHPLGATGTGLITKAIHRLEEADKKLALVTICCGGGLGTGTLLRRAAA